MGEAGLHHEDKQAKEMQDKGERILEAHCRVPQRTPPDHLFA